ncbi:MAG: class I adenylate-forming enzyme family protein, partial [Pseudomonadota bacterium]
MYQELSEVWDAITGKGGPFEITEVDVRGQQIKAFAGAPPTLRDVWLLSAQHGEADYLIYQDERITYAEAHRRVAAIANWLQAQGVEPGDRVAIAMRNYPEWLLSYWAIVSIGAAVVGVNAWWVGPELEYGLNDSAPKVLIADQERLDRALEHIDALPPMKIVGVRTAAANGVVPWSELVNHGGELPDVAIDPDDDACIFYTSGTTGHPKGAQLTHRGCTNNIMNLAFAAGLGTALAERMGNPVPAPAEDAPPPAALVTTPLFHVTANNCVAHGMTLNGGKLVHMYKWDPLEALKLIEREKVSTFTGVPTMARELIAHPEFGSYDTSSLAAVGGGGAQLQPDLVG